MMRCTRKYVSALVLVLAGLLLFGGPAACSKEEIRRTLPAKQGF
jgi:uncharacterized protein YjeT (DUF2065 family)